MTVRWFIVTPAGVGGVEGGMCGHSVGDGVRRVRSVCVVLLEETVMWREGEECVVLLQEVLCW